jgi:hypothetical protein
MSTRKRTTAKKSIANFPIDVTSQQRAAFKKVAAQSSDPVLYEAELLAFVNFVANSKGDPINAAVNYFFNKYIEIKQILNAPTIKVIAAAETPRPTSTKRRSTTKKKRR